MKCEYCEKEFSNKYTLSTHQSNTKYCLEKQGKSLSEKNKCNYCKQIFTTVQRLDIHLQNCKTKEILIQKEEKEEEYKIIIENELKDKDKLIIELRNELKHSIITNKQLSEKNKELEEKLFSILEKAVNKPTTTNTTNNYIEKLEMISPEHLNQQSVNLTMDHLKQGALGYSSFFLEHSLKDRVVCTDFSRRKLKYKDENGEVITDPDMTSLSKLLFKSIKDRNKELSIRYIEELNQKTKEQPNSSFYFMELAQKFGQQDVDFAKMLNGDKNGMYHDIIREICCKTILN